MATSKPRRAKLLAVLLGAVSLLWAFDDVVGNWLLAPEELAPELIVEAPHTQYPMVFLSESLESNIPIETVSTFEPFFGRTRQAVNPAAVRVDSGSLYFAQPGEYYLRLNDTRHLKVLVFSCEESPRQALSRLFDFVVANSLYCNADDMRFYEGREAYLQHWFSSAEPASLLCGPTHRFFRMLVADRFALPTRIVTFPGVYRYDGKIERSTHNVPEVYLPDLGKWVLTDVNYAFMPKWLDAMQIARFVHQRADAATGLVPEGALSSLQAHQTPRTFAARERLTVRGHDASENVSSTSTQSLWHSSFRFYNSGAAYWGGQQFAPNGTEFLDGHYQVHVASLHDEAELVEELSRWLGEFDLRVRIASPEEVRAELGRGHRGVIQTAAWRQRVPCGPTWGALQKEPGDQRKQREEEDDAVDHVTEE